MRTIPRIELVATVAECARPCAARNRRRLLDLAETTERFAVGWFFSYTPDGGHVGCLARQIDYSHMGFQEAFDRAMAARFGVEIDENEDRPAPFDPFVVEVTDA